MRPILSRVPTGVLFVLAVAGWILLLWGFGWPGLALGVLAGVLGMFKGWMETG